MSHHGKIPIDVASNQGFANAQYNLGIAYLKGYGVEKDQKKAVELLTLASMQNHAVAQYILGKC